jgi:hypothetical protein
MLEFALLAPFLFILLLGLVDFARAVFYYNVTSSAAREGAREAILSYNQCSNVNPGAGNCQTLPAGTSLVGIKQAIIRAGGGIMTFDWTNAQVTTDTGTPAKCTPQPNQGCVFVFITGTGNACTDENGVPDRGPGPTDFYSLCNFNQNKASGNFDVVVEIQYKFAPFAPLIASLVANGGITWAKSEMRAEF